MRNNKFSLGILLALFILVAGVSSALAPDQAADPPPPPEKQTEKQQEQTAADPPPTGEDPADPKAPQRFIPSAETSADNNVTFPVDI